MSEIQIVRQPVYTRTLHVFGYDLFYNYGTESLSSAATTEAVLAALADIGLEQIVGSKKALLSLSQPFLQGDFPIPVSKERALIQVLDRVSDVKIVQNLAKLAHQGYGVVFGDFIYHEKTGNLIDLASIVKIDARSMDERELEAFVKQMRRKEGLKLLADHIETQEQFTFCKEIGFNFFQGDFFCKPKVVKRPRIPANKVAMVQLLSELQRQETAVSRLEELISRDVALSYKLLLYLNSAFFGLPKQVESIQRAIVFLGLAAIKKWATLLLLARVGDKPNELLVTAVVRARMCELLAEAVEFEERDSCFTVGLLSVLDALLDMPMEKALDALSLTEEVNQALSDHVGTPGEILECVLNYEQCNWDEARYGGLDQTVIKDSYLQAVDWANNACKVIIGDY